ncbi:MAG: two-component regulator propeller domain-containing protein, partial [Bacteroidota bacterium]
MKWMGWRWLLLLLLSLPIQRGQGQPVSGIRYGVEQGLPSSRVYAVRQDARGLIWIATDKGVVRFDGVSFRVYSASDGLENTDVWGLIPDHHGRMWLLSYSHYLHFLEGDSLHRIPSPLPTEAFPLYGLIDDGRDITVNLGGHPGMQYTMTLGTADTATPEVRLHHAPPLLLGIDAFGHRIRYAAGDTVQVHIQYTTTNRSERIAVPLPPGEIMTQLLLMADFRRVVLRTDQALYQLNYHTHQLVRKPFDVLLAGWDTLPDVPRIQVTDSLVFLWCHGAMQALNLALEPTALLPETTGNIQAAFRDREGNFWLSTDGQGVQFIPAQRLLVDHVPLTANRQPTEVTAMATLDEHRLLISRGDGALQVISENSRQTVLPAQWLSGTGLRWREPLRLMPAKDHQLWLLTDEYVLRATHTDGPIAGWRWQKVQAVLGQEMYFKDAVPDGFGGCWLATSRGTFHLTEDGALTEQCALRTSALARSTSGTLWMGTSNGILRHANGVTDYPGGALPLITSSTKLLALENDSAVWVHYSGKGIGLLEGQQWHPVPGTEHLQVHALTRHDALYVAHHQGIARISRVAHHPDSFRLEALPVHGALLTPEVRHLVVSDSVVMVGTAMGLSAIRQPDRPVFVPPLIRLTTVQWGNQFLNLADAARLERSEQRLRIGFQ